MYLYFIVILKNYIRTFPLKKRKEKGKHKPSQGNVLTYRGSLKKREKNGPPLSLLVGVGGSKRKNGVEKKKKKF